jgi:hypothetical protein
MRSASPDSASAAPERKPGRPAKNPLPTTALALAEAAAKAEVKAATKENAGQENLSASALNSAANFQLYSSAARALKPSAAPATAKPLQILLPNKPAARAVAPAPAAVEVAGPRPKKKRLAPPPGALLRSDEFESEA